MTTQLSSLPISSKPFKIALLANFIWINVSEVFRYFAFVMPMMREGLPGVKNVASMGGREMLIWAAWDTILVFTLTFVVWIFLDRFGSTLKHSLIGALLVWMAVFVIFWVGAANMNLAPLQVVVIALPLSCLEMLIGGWIVWYSRERFG